MPDLVHRLSADAAAGASIAVGIEAPAFVPVPADHTILNSARDGEGDRPWSYGAGGYTTAVGIQQAAWIVRALAVSAKTTHELTTDWHRWPESNGERPLVLLWEAFVSKAAHSPTNNPVEDAATAAHEILEE